MKRLIATFAAVLLATAPAFAGAHAITNYYSGYKYVPASTNAGSTGLATNTAYVCIPLATLSQMTAAQASSTGATSDVRALLYAIGEEYNDGYDSTVANTTTIDRKTTYTTSGATVTEYVTHILQARRTVGSYTWP